MTEYCRLLYATPKVALLPVAGDAVLALVWIGLTAAEAIQCHLSSHLDVTGVRTAIGHSLSR